MLEQIEAQVGRAQYHNLVGALGEDGLIDAALTQLEGAQAARPVKKKLGFWGVCWMLLKALALTLLVAWLFGTPTGNQLLGGILYIAFFLFLQYLIQAVGSAFSRWAGDDGEVARQQLNSLRNVSGILSRGVQESARNR